MTTTHNAFPQKVVIDAMLSFEKWIECIYGKRGNLGGGFPSQSTHSKHRNDDSKNQSIFRLRRMGEKRFSALCNAPGVYVSAWQHYTCACMRVPPMQDWWCEWAVCAVYQWQLPAEHYHGRMWTFCFGVFCFEVLPYNECLKHFLVYKRA